MAEINSIQDFHAHLDTVCTSLEKLCCMASDEHQDFVDVAEPAIFLFRQLLDLGASQGWAK